MLRFLIGPDLTRWWLGFRCPSGPLKEYYRTDTPTLDTPYTRASFLVIDLETTGFDPETDDILSVGCVPIDGGRIRMADSLTFLVKPERPVSEASARVHGLLDDHLASAPPLADVLPRILLALTGRIAVAHHARMEREFLAVACRRVFGQPLEVPFIDTLTLEQRVLERRGQPISDGALRLGACRERHGLPYYRAHHALSDALAAAELFLVQAAHGSGREDIRLRDLM